MKKIVTFWKLTYRTRKLHAGVYWQNNNLESFKRVSISVLKLIKLLLKLIKYHYFKYDLAFCNYVFYYLYYDLDT